jgi:protein-disulfide isomerase
MKLMFVVAAALMVTACQQDSRNVDQKLAQIQKDVADIKAAIGKGGAAGAAAQRPSRPEPDRTKTYALPIDGDPFDGPADAKVTLVKAYDYACPYCEKVRDTMDELRKKYGNDLRIVYKQFVVHPQVATAGALAFCAAGRQGKAVDMDKLLWEKSFKSHTFDKDASDGGQSQKCWESSAGCPVVLGYAKELGLNEDKFKTDMKDCQTLVQKDMRDLQTLGVGATPSFFVNGRFMSGAMPMENFTALIDEEMKKADAAISAGTPKAEYYKQVVVDKGLKTLEAPKQ